MYGEANARFQTQIFSLRTELLKKKYLRVVIVAETFSEGVMVYFQLSDLCKEQGEGNERM